MKPISTEDEGMEKIYIAVFVLSIVIMLANPFFATPSSILDTDPSTYIIVPIVMLPLLSIFTFKSKIKPKAKRLDLLVGFILFILFLFIITYLRYTFSFLFMSYRLDMLILPLAIASITITIFGFKEINKFKALMIFALFASPIILTPIFFVNQNFAEVNAYIVYVVMHAFDKSVAFTPPISISGNGYAIGIGESCAGIGALIGIIMFLIPIAYLLNGKLRAKILWVLSGFILLLILNFIRMVTIGFTWLWLGPSQSTSFAHSFAGVLIFYITIIVIILATPLFKLKVPKVTKPSGKRIARRKARHALSPLILPIVYALLYFLLTTNYANSIYVSPALMHANAALNGSAFENFISSNVNTTGFTTVSYLFSNTSDILLFVNQTFNKTNPIAMLITAPNIKAEKELLANMSILGNATFMNKNGINIYLYKVYSNKTIYYMGFEELPYVFDDEYYVESEYFIMPEVAGSLNLKCGYSKFTYLFNILNPNFYNATKMNELESAYCINEKIFR